MSSTNLNPLNPTDSSMGQANWAAIEARVRKQLIWKESRLLLPACLGLIALAVAGMVAWGCFPARLIGDNAGVFIAMALGGGAMAALVCGGMAFAPERENKTDAFLARLPLDGRRLVKTKVWTAVVFFVASYLVSLLAAVGLFAAFFNGSNLLILVGDNGVLGAVAPFAFAMPVIVFLWTLVFSRYSSSTLNAVFSAVACSLVVPLVIFSLVGLLATWSIVNPTTGQWLVVGMFVANVVLLVAAIGYRPEAWLRPGTVSDAKTKLSSHRGASWSMLAAEQKASFSSSMQSLLWQTFRFHWVGLTVVALISGLYLVIALSTYYTGVVAGGGELACVVVEYSNDLFAAALGTAAGIFLFAKDQRNGSFQFFQQRADYPRRIWLSRMIGLAIVGAIVVSVVAVVNNVLYGAIVGQVENFKLVRSLGSFQTADFRQDEYAWLGDLFGQGLAQGGSLEYFYFLTFRTATMFFVVAGVGQLVSIFCRHGILNAILGTVFCFIAAIWVRYVNWYQVPTWIYAWPIVLAAFGLSWWYSPSWIRGTRQMRSAMVAFAVMVLVGVGCVLGLRTDRLNDFPRQPLFADLEEVFDNPEKLKMAGDARFEVAREVESAEKKIGVAWNELRENDLDSTAEDLRDLKPSKAEFELVKNYETEFETIVSAVQKPNIRYYFYQSPDAASAAMQSKWSFIYDCLNLYHAAKGADANAEVAFDALSAKFALEVNRGYVYTGPFAKRLLDWGDDESRTVAELELGIAKLCDLIAGHTATINLHRVEVQHSALLAQIKEHQESGSRFKTNFGLPWEVERTKRRVENDLLVDFRQRSPRTNSGIAEMVGPSFHGLKRAENFGAPGRQMLGWLDSWSVKGDWSFERNRLWMEYVKIRFALAAWKLESGSYPERLTQLDGRFLNKGSQDSGLGKNRDSFYESFSYYPSGRDKSVVLISPINPMWSWQNSFYPRKAENAIPEEVPFLLPWQAAPSEEVTYVIETKNEEGTEVISKTKPEIGYMMHPGYVRGYQLWDQHSRRQAEIFILGEK